MRTAVAFLLVMVITVPVLAGPPLNGTFKSVDLGGTVLLGRYTEWWSGGVGPLQANNTLNEKSWNGALLGTQWWWHCPYLALPPQLLLNTVNGSGNGNKIWRLTYAGGLCVFDGAGPWGNGDATYTALANLWVVILTETYSGFSLAGAVRTTNVQATFLGYNADCMGMSISNNVFLGDTATGTIPPNYPLFWDWSGCNAAGAQVGEWGDVTGITIDIAGCDVVPVAARTWGAIKSMYRE